MSKRSEFRCNRFKKPKPPMKVKGIGGTFHLIEDGEEIRTSGCFEPGDSGHAIYRFEKSKL